MAKQSLQSQVDALVKANPSIASKDVIRQLPKAHKQSVYVAVCNARRKLNSAPTPRRSVNRAPATPVSLNQLSAAAQLVQSAGGFDQALAAVKMLQQVQV